MSRVYDRSGDEWQSDGLPFRVRTGRKGEGDEVIEWFTPTGWHPIGVTAVARIVEFLCLNEDQLFDPARHAGGRKVLARLATAYEHGWRDARDRLNDERSVAHRRRVS